MTKHPDLFAALAAPFEPHEVKVRDQSGRKLSYITARTVMNRLDNVIGPENWSDDYEPFGEGGVKCRLTVVLPDGAAVTKTGIGGITEMHDGSDTDKTGESDALKRAAVKFGVARYLYRDGVPNFVQERAPAVETTAIAHPRDAGLPPPGKGESYEGDLSRDRTQGVRHAGHDSPPRTGKALFAWARKIEERSGKDVVKWLGRWGKVHGMPDRMVDWSGDQAENGYHAATEKLREYEKQQADEPYTEALAN